MHDAERVRKNNYDLIRLFAAAQVVLVHAVNHLGVEAHAGLMKIVHLFPGVPIFFFISGFLIARSFESNSRLAEYAQNRILRIYPALFTCFFLSILSVWAVGYWATVSVDWADYMSWSVAQLSLAQFYNPDFLRGYGVGALNGALWTITVELQFYVLVPMIYALFRLQDGSLRRKNIILLLLIGVFLLLNRAYHGIDPQYQEALWKKLLGVSFAPWFYMFLIGVLVQSNFSFFYRLLAGRFAIFLVAYLACALWAKPYWGLHGGNEFSPLLYLPLVAVIFSAAYSASDLSRRLLGRHDISYGVYIYHMPIINACLYLGYRGEVEYLLWVVSATLVMAILSWRVVERPSLKLKKHPLNPLNFSADKA